MISVTEVTLMGDRGERIPCWCLDGSTYCTKEGNTREQAIARRQANIDAMARHRQEHPEMWDRK